MLVVLTFPAGATVTISDLSILGVTPNGNKTFTYWDTQPGQSGSGTRYYPGDTIVLNGNLTLYANWTNGPVTTTTQPTTTTTTRPTTTATTTQPTTTTTM